MKLDLFRTMLCVLATCSANAAVRYVDLNNPSPAAPFTSWATAATNIQDAIDAATAGDEIVVTNGVYATGGRTVTDPNGFVSDLNRVAVDKAVSVRSVNGPQATIILGLKADLDPVRCVYLTNGASLSGFTLTNGAARPGGGGIWCAFTTAVVSNCVIIGNSASTGGGGAWGGTLIACKLVGNTASAGGGAWGPISLNNCLVVGNSASISGGGIQAGSFAALSNCTIVSNTAPSYGGIMSSNGPIINSIIYYNQAQTAPNHFIFRGAGATNSCTMPLPGLSLGAGNITNEPAFVDFEGGDFRLQPNSPCVDTGNNNYVMGATDFDGAPRIRGSAVDIGAYEFQGSQPILKIAKSAEGAVLIWPQWASDFALQQVGYTPGHVGGWSNLIALPTVTNGENAVTVPIDGEVRLYRLFKP